jgi:cation diffusion facilitator CzcD-associated flavoprotein CzcO/acetyl esterase/lipase
MTTSERAAKAAGNSTPDDTDAMPLVAVHPPTSLRERWLAPVLRLLMRQTLYRLLAPRWSVATQRRWVDRLAVLAPPPRGVRFTRSVVAGVPGEWVDPVSNRSTPPSPAPADGRPVLLYLHGGGYCVGSARSHRAVTGSLARRGGWRVFVPDYRLAPEHPFPAALEDALSVFRALRSAGPVVVGGDSAGGGLSLSLALACRDGGEPAPAALLLLAPWTRLMPDPADLAAAQRGAEPIGEAVLRADWGAACAAAYAGDNAAATAERASPGLADLLGLPPVLIQVGTDEWLYPDALQLHRRLRQAGGTGRCEVIHGRWHVFQLHAGLLPSADDALQRAVDFAHQALAQARPMRVDTQAARGIERVDVVVLGAGMSGLCTAIELRRAGMHDFVVLEKSAGLGGTWWDNRYPGAHVDVPAPLYSLSFEPNPGWTRRFASAPDIQRYQQRVALRHGLAGHLQFGETLTEARFDDASATWHLRTAGGRHLVARHFVCSLGPLSKPRWPDIPGLASFAGERLHSARWPADASLAGRCVAVIGTGSTASQLIPPIAEQAANLVVFQRTANWVLPRLDRRYTALDRGIARIPLLAHLAWRFWFEGLEITRRGLDVGTASHRRLERWAHRHRKKAIADEWLRAALTPAYPIGCKRLIYSNDFYPALARPNVTLVTQPIERITAHGIATTDGCEHRVDTLVCATGFDLTHLLQSIAITGRAGTRLEDVWAGAASAHRGVTVPGFPNLFLMLGPNTATGHTSTLPYIEAQASFAVQAMSQVSKTGTRTIEVRPDVFERFNASLQTRLAGSVWTRCSSWYRGHDGRVTAIWPGSTREYRQALLHPDWAEYRTH